jgi:hypothetical protein
MKILYNVSNYKIKEIIQEFNTRTDENVTIHYYFNGENNNYTLTTKGGYVKSFENCTGRFGTYITDDESKVGFNLHRGMENIKKNIFYIIEFDYSLLFYPD